METVAEILLALVIIGTTLAFGGVEPITYSLMEVGVFLALFLLLFKQTREGRISLPLPLWPALFAMLVALQVVPLPAGLLARLSPARLQDPDLASLAQGKMAWASISIYAHDTGLTLLQLLAYLSAFVLAARLFDSRKGKSILVSSLILLGAFEAAYGIVQYVTGWHKIFTYLNQYSLQAASGTYINRNHYVALLELTLPFVIASVFYYFQLWSGRSGGGRHRSSDSSRGSAGPRSIFFLNLAMVMVVGVVFSRSRGGIIATVLGLLFVALLAQLRVRRKAWMLGAVLFLAGVFGYGLWIGLDPVLARFEQVQAPGFVKMEGRILFWKDDLRLIRDFPLTGTGLGTFPVAYHRYQTTAVGSFVPHVHNDYLEFVSDTGLVGAALVFLPIFYLFAKMLLTFLEDAPLYRRAVTLGCIGSTLMLLVHSFTDFNLQIPANALIFSVVLGIGYKAVCLEPRVERAVSPAEMAGAGAQHER